MEVGRCQYVQSFNFGSIIRDLRGGLLLFSSLGRFSKEGEVELLDDGDD